MGWTHEKQVSVPDSYKFPDLLLDCEDEKLSRENVPSIVKFLYLANAFGNPESPTAYIFLIRSIDRDWRISLYRVSHKSGSIGIFTKCAQ